MIHLIYFGLSFLFVLPLWGETGITGIYEGNMHLTDGGVERDIPLAVSLQLTDETIILPSGTEYIIEGSFVVDEEGGPFSFASITYDFENNRLDLKYRRDKSSPNSSASSFRLVGELDGDGGISGKVFTNTLGKIGDFSIKINEKLKAIPTRIKYLGVWKGKGLNVRFNRSAQIEIGLSKTLNTIANPLNYEFEYTLGKVAYYKYNGSDLGGFHNITIDY